MPHSQSGSAENGPTTGEAESAVRNAVIKFEQEFMEQGPEEVRAFIIKDIVKEPLQILHGSARSNFQGHIYTNQAEWRERETKQGTAGRRINKGDRRAYQGIQRSPPIQSRLRRQTGLRLNRRLF